MNFQQSYLYWLAGGGLVILAGRCHYGETNPPPACARGGFGV